MSLSPDSDLILLFCRLESEKAGYKHFLHKKFPDRVRKSGHRTFYNILHKQDKMDFTVPQFDPYIYLFAKQKNNEEGKRDISSWRGNVVENDNEEISFRAATKTFGICKIFSIQQCHHANKVFLTLLSLIIGEAFF